MKFTPNEISIIANHIMSCVRWDAAPKGANLDGVLCKAVSPAPVPRSVAEGIAALIGIEYPLDELRKDDRLLQTVCFQVAENMDHRAGSEILRLAEHPEIVLKQARCLLDGKKPLTNVRK